LFYLFQDVLEGNGLTEGPSDIKLGHMEVKDNKVLAV